MTPTSVPLNPASTYPNSSLSQGLVLSCSWAETGPNWTEARETLQYGLEVHIYFFGGCFSVILSYAVFYLIVALGRRHRGRRRLGISLHIALASSSLMRAISLFVDPYGSRMLLPCPANVIVWSFGWPGIVSAYSIFLLAVLETTKLSIGPPRIQRPSTLAAIIAVSLIYVLVSDLLASYMYIPSGIISILLCELIFILWGLVLATGFVYVWWRIRKNLSASCPRNEKERRRNSAHGGVTAISAEEARRLRRLIAVISISALNCIILTATHIVPVVGMFLPEVVDFVSRPWHWFVYQTGQRILEVTICVLIIIAMMKSPSLRKTNRYDLSDKLRLASKPEGTGNGADHQTQGYCK